MSLQQKAVVLEKISKTFARITGRLIGLGLVSIGGLCGVYYYESFWKHRDCIRESLSTGGQGCYVSADVMVYDGDSEFLLIPAIILVVLGISLIALAGWKPKIRP